MTGTVRRFPMRRPKGLRYRVRPRYRGPSFNRIIPNLMTVAGLCAGLTAMRFALEGRFDAAAIAIAIAGVIDGLDGRLARLLQGTSRFGAEFDSLSDFACFGIAPGFTLYQWSLQRMGGTGYTVCVLFAVCMALRLARFNAMLETPGRPAYTANFFTGVPAPAGAGLVLFPLFAGLEAKLLHWEWLYTIVHAPVFCALVLVGTALLLVSTLPVWNFKNFKMRANMVLPTMLGIGLYAALMVADPWGALAIGGLIYIGMLPFSVRSYRQLKRMAETGAAG